MNEIQKKLLYAAKMSHEKNVLSVLKDVDLIEALDLIEKITTENTDLHEQVAALESKEVCTEPHDDSVLEGCPYCRIEALVQYEDLVFRFIDRMFDACEADPAEQILEDYTKAFWETWNSESGIAARVLDRQTQEKT